jgi:hypothetical protein
VSRSKQESSLASGYDACQGTGIVSMQPFLNFSFRFFASHQSVDEPVVRSLLNTMFVHESRILVGFPGLRHQRLGKDATASACTDNDDVIVDGHGR